MKRIIFLGNKQTELRTLPDPNPGPGEVLVERKSSALCGSEMKDWRGAGVPGGNPGHEAVGVIVAIGEGVPKSRLGERIGVSAIVGCGICDECEAGRPTWCDKKSFHCNTHADRFIYPAAGCLPLPEEASWDEGVLLSGDGLGVPYHTSLKLTDPRIRTIVIFGMGPIGLGSVLLQSHFGRRVISVDVGEDRLQLARELGAAEVINGKNEDAVKRVKELTSGRGADAAIEAAGSAFTLKQAFASVAKGGLVAMNGEIPEANLSPSEDFIRRDIRAVGSWFYHVNEYEPMVRLFRAGLPVKKLVTHHFPLEKAAEAYATMDNRQGGKVFLAA